MLIDTTAEVLMAMSRHDFNARVSFATIVEAGGGNLVGRPRVFRRSIGSFYRHRRTRTERGEWGTVDLTDIVVSPHRTQSIPPSLCVRHVAREIDERFCNALQNRGDGCDSRPCLQMLKTLCRNKRAYLSNFQFMSLRVFA